MSASGINAGALAWSRSDEGRECSRKRAIANLEIIHAAPRCGAKTRSTGLPCRQPGLGRGGRCIYHGGRSTAGETWGLRQWRDNASPVVTRRMLTKAEHIERLDAERALRIAAMSPEDHARHEKRQKSHAPGSVEDRAARKLLTAYQSRPADPQNYTIAELEALIAELKAVKAQASEGVFG